VSYASAVDEIIAREIREKADIAAPPEPPEPEKLHMVVLEYHKDHPSKLVSTTLYNVAKVRVDGVDVLAKPAAPPAPDPFEEFVRLSRERGRSDPNLI
jgi:hypothetical protein